MAGAGGVRKPSGGILKFHTYKNKAPVLSSQHQALRAAGALSFPLARGRGSEEEGSGCCSPKCCGSLWVHLWRHRPLTCLALRARRQVDSGRASVGRRPGPDGGWGVESALPLMCLWLRMLPTRGCAAGVAQALKSSNFISILRGGGRKPLLDALISSAAAGREVKIPTWRAVLISSEKRVKITWSWNCLVGAERAGPGPAGLRSTAWAWRGAGRSGWGALARSAAEKASGRTGTRRQAQHMGASGSTVPSWVAPVSH